MANVALALATFVTLLLIIYIRYVVYPIATGLAIRLNGGVELQVWLAILLGAGVPLTCMFFLLQYLERERS